MSKFLVTQGDYLTIISNNPSYFLGDTNRPVEQVSWYDATNYCFLLTQKELAAGRLPCGWIYRLPTEAEWEFACRAGTTTRFSFGDDPDYTLIDSYAWYSKNSNGTTHQVGTKRPNPWGLEDMQGDAAEWCLDWYGAYPVGNITNPTGPLAGDLRVFRGGSWSWSPWDLTSAHRGYNLPTLVNKGLGFRVILAPSEPITNPNPSELIWIPPGTFLMGSPTNEEDRRTDESPQTQVTLTRGFYMSKYLVTQGDYLTVISNNPSHFLGDTNRPVEQVSWYDATNYCFQLTKKESLAGRLPSGWIYRLPTEAEWEYACRAGTITRFTFGDDPNYTLLGLYAWYFANAGGKPPYFYDGGSRPVGTKLPSPWGLYDMYGNVAEWCMDSYGIYTGGSVTNPVVPVTGSAPVPIFRGFSWGSDPWDCRSASRGYNFATYTHRALGFRVILAPNDQVANPNPSELAWIPQGIFTMGSSTNDEDWWFDEIPQTVVTVQRGFFMSKYLVTQGAYLGVTGNNPSHFLGDTNRPVEQVNWFDATNYCFLLTQKELAAGRLPPGWIYRLPTEAEWEYACRAGTTTRFSFGDDPDYTLIDSYAWYETNSGGTLHPIGMKQPNPWGLFDTYGNVREWCWSAYAPYPGGNIVNEAIPATGSRPAPVVRGGSWSWYDWELRSASRDFNWAPLANNDLGFRVVLAPTEP